MSKETAQDADEKDNNDENARASNSEKVKEETELKHDHKRTNDNEDDKTEKKISDKENEKVKAKGRPLISSSLKASRAYFPGTKAGFEVFEIKIKADDDFSREIQIDTESAKADGYDVCPEADHFTAAPEIHGKVKTTYNGSWFNRMKTDLKYRGKILKSLSVFWAFSVLVSFFIHCFCIVVIGQVCGFKVLTYPLYQSAYGLIFQWGSILHFMV